MITQEELKKLFYYDPNTGLFTRLIKTARRHKVGEVAGNYYGNGYMRLMIKGKEYMLHRLAWLYVYGEMPADKQIDHINCIKDDNRINNLRLATGYQNSSNQRISRRNTAGHKGVFFNKSRGKYQAYCAVRGKRYYLGAFRTSEEAGIAYNNFASKHHGEFFRAS